MLELKAKGVISIFVSRQDLINFEICYSEWCLKNTMESIQFYYKKIYESVSN